MDIEDYPQIRNFWDFEKNTIDPQSVSPGSTYLHSGNAENAAMNGNPP